MKLCLAAICQKINRIPLERLESCKFVLESFYYIKEKFMDYYLSRDFFIMDSGAFTFRESKKGASGSFSDYMDFTLRYADFIKKYNIQYFFEMDIDTIVGLKHVEELRCLLEARTGKRCIPVWHIERGKEYFINMCKKYPYVAIGGIAGGTNQQYANYQKYFPWFIKTAHQYDAKIHGLGFTPSNLHQYRFDSVDSSSWTSGSRYGQLHQFNGHGIRYINPPKKRIARSADADNYNFLEWCAYQRFLERF